MQRLAPFIKQDPAPPRLTQREITNSLRIASISGTADRVRVDGKFFAVNGACWDLRGLSYGPFRPNSTGAFLPEPPQLLADFAHIRQLGATALRLYHVPSGDVLDAAIAADLRLFIDVPWQKHRCFFEDWEAQREARHAVQAAARTAGRHPGCFAVSVANEIPHDIVRLYGHRRMSRFLDDLLAAAKDEAPDCLVTYCNYPSTEFLVPSGLDFYCSNVYLHDPEKLGSYVDRLHHVAGSLPVVLGEHGIDALRQGEARQAQELVSQVRTASRRGLAGTFVFSYTDDWFTGGASVEDWAFGVTDRDRQEKPAARLLRETWTSGDRLVPANGISPRVSVVVCSYNGAETLDECLCSLLALDYPDYEVILVDDGSTDSTRSIAERFPTIRYLWQENRGLSAARNAGLHAATGSIVAYTDADCVVDPAWLRGLICAMSDQAVDAIGGPNLPPASDGPVARCVAVSPGGPSHVMLDDRLAEHVPGCNMAFARDKLMALGGFDEQFRQAGDDVDICWRFLDQGLRIGYAPAALVWHHRRATVGAYLRQQVGYGRSEAMVLLKHPARAGALGGAKWRGVIYGDGAMGPFVSAGAVFHGKFGTGTYQIIYRSNEYSTWVYFTLLEWHAAAAFVLTLSAAWLPLLVVAGAMWSLTIAAAARSSLLAPLPKSSPRWCRALVFALHLAQPVTRAWHRYAHRLALLRSSTSTRTPSEPVRDSHGAVVRRHVKTIGWRIFDQYWSSANGRGREHLLDALAQRTKRHGCFGDFDAEWHAHDLELWPSMWHVARVRTATEELGQGKRFTRARVAVQATGFARLVAVPGALWVISGLFASRPLLGIIGASLLAAWTIILLWDRWRVKRAVAGLLHAAGLDARLQPVLRTAPEHAGSEVVKSDRADVRCGTAHPPLHDADDEELAPVT